MVKLTGGRTASGIVFGVVFSLVLLLSASSAEAEDLVLWDFSDILPGGTNTESTGTSYFPTIHDCTASQIPEGGGSPSLWHGEGTWLYLQSFGANLHYVTFQMDEEVELTSVYFTHTHNHWNATDRYGYDAQLQVKSGPYGDGTGFTNIGAPVAFLPADMGSGYGTGSGSAEVAISYTATPGVHTIRWQCMRGGAPHDVSGDYCALDNVTLKGPTLVPEPTTTLLSRQDSGG
ncbi:hypothetical protein ACFL59_11845 [Planctomycetota bacterium]